METLLESLFIMPEETLSDWQAVVNSEGSKDPCGTIDNSDLKALFTTRCEESGFGTSYFAPGLNIFFRGDISSLKEGKSLVRAYRSESTGKIVLVPIKIATACPCRTFSELLSRVQIKGALKPDSEEPAL